MSRSAIAPEQLADLRLRAASRLNGGGAAKAAPVTGSDALAVLHGLASSPDTAIDALALLHELQVHQVELDLQAEELRESRSELEAALRRQIELYDCQPVGCFTTDRRLVVHELNLTGAGMLGVARDEALGMPLDSFLSPQSSARLLLLISNIAQGKAADASTLQLAPKGGTDRPVLVHVNADPAGDRFLMVFATADDGREAQADRN